MAWTKELPKQKGTYWVKLNEYGFLFIAHISIYPYYTIYIDGQMYSLNGRKLKDALFWDEPIQEPPKP